MELSEQQQRFFTSFGFLHLQGLMADEVGWITEEFEAARADSGADHRGTARTSFSDSAERRQRLCALIEHPRIHGVLTGLLGADFLYLGMGAELYVGDSLWHPDQPARPPVTFVKLAMYLDELTPETGALRLVPGSHVQGYEGNLDTRALWGADPLDVPSHNPSNTPGDVIVFNLQTVHNALGGGNRRRMWNIVCCNDSDSPEATALLDRRLAGRTEPLYSDTMVRTAPPARRRHLERVLEREATLKAAAIA
ncbi:MAG: phytanoyl-CoA dioxygenase family protein [bacterium]|nr:phytanoyl-CoA dioxygenase family protein [bacterium]